jgi:hypothetical protein
MKHGRLEGDRRPRDRERETRQIKVADRGRERARGGRDRKRHMIEAGRTR